MSPPPPPPPPPLCLPSFTRKGKKKQLEEQFDDKSASYRHSASRSGGSGGSRGSRGTQGSRGSRGSQSSLPESQRPATTGSPLARSGSFSPTATVTDAQSRAEADVASRVEKLTFSEDTESYNNLPRMAPKLDRSRSKLTRGNTLRNKLGYGWGLGLGRKDKDKDKDDLFTEIDRTSSATTILPVYPRDAPPSFPPESTQSPTRHMSQRSKSSQASKQSNDSQASRATKASNLSRGSKRSNNSQGGSSVKTLTGSALERKDAYLDPIREPVDTYVRLTELRKHMAKENLDY
jgi:hypothetical protein